MFLTANYANLANYLGVVYVGLCPTLPACIALRSNAGRLAGDGQRYRDWLIEPTLQGIGSQCVLSPELLSQNVLKQKRKIDD